MEEQNPWWLGEEHHKIAEWSQYRVRWVPSIIDFFDVDGFSLNFIVGPRQVGKTLSMLLYIRKKLQEGANPRTIFYYACDEISDYRELGEILDLYLSARKSWGVRRSLIFLDEITMVHDWQYAIKYLWDIVSSRIVSHS